MSEENQYSALRNQALTVDRATVGIPSTGGAKPWGVVMDIAYDNATITVCGFDDGSASLYFSNGGGFVGGGRHESVRQAAKALVAKAESFQPDMGLVTDFPLAKTGEVVFYLRTDEGVYSARVQEREFPDHPLTHLFLAAQGVITAYRLIDQAKS